MKAFGVRLAAGAVTILLGAIMAVQAQKDQQANTESGWTEQQIPPGTAATPIGSSAAPSENGGSAQDGETWDAQSLPAIADAEPLSGGSASDVPLVQPTEPADSSDADVIRAPKMTMLLPGFNDAPQLPDFDEAAVEPQPAPSEPFEPA